MSYYYSFTDNEKIIVIENWAQNVHFSYEYKILNEVNILAPSNTSKNFGYCDFIANEIALFIEWEQQKQDINK